MCTYMSKRQNCAKSARMALTRASPSAVAATVFADLGEPITGAIFAGAATTGPASPMLTWAHTDLDQTIERLHATLGADAYDTEAARGAAISSDDLLRFLRQAVNDALVVSPG